jgi:type I restriction enzyme, S subunit
LERRQILLNMKKYTNYKDSGIEWIGEIPSHWEVDKLFRLFKINTGFTPSTSNSEYYENGEYDWITISDLESKFVSTSKIKLTKKAIEGKDFVPKGSLLYSFKLSVGKMAFAEKDIYTNEAIFSIYPDENINLNYYYYLLDRVLIHNSNENIYGAKILNQEIIKAAKLIVPPHSEQTAIANFLDHKTAQIDDLIAQKEQLISLLEEERTAIINELVTGKKVWNGKEWTKPEKTKNSGIEWLGEIPEEWEVKRMRYLCDIGTGSKDTENREDDGEYPFYVRSQIVERISTYSFDGEAILTAGDGVGVCKVWHYVNGKFDYHQRVYRMSDFKDIEGKFLFYYLKDNFIKEVMKLSAKSTVDSLRRPMFQNFMIAFPVINAQNIIIQHINEENDRIDNLVLIYNQEIDLLKEYKTALISEVVTGKVDVSTSSIQD